MRVLPGKLYLSNSNNNASIICSDINYSETDIYANNLIYYKYIRLMEDTGISQENADKFVNDEIYIYQFNADKHGKFIRIQ